MQIQHGTLCNHTHNQHVMTHTVIYNQGTSLHTQHMVAGTKRLLFFSETHKPPDTSNITNKIFIHTLRSLRFMWWEYFGDDTIRLENLHVLSPTSVYDSLTGSVEDSTL